MTTSRNSEQPSPSVSRPPAFKRMGRSYHLRIESANDLPAVIELDETHWVATSSPLNALNLDESFLRFIDIDGDGRITCADVKTAASWLLTVMSDTSGISDANTTVSLASINGEHPDGSRIIETAKRIIRRTPGSGQQVNLQQVRELKRAFEANPVSEEGVVLPQAAPDGDLRRFIDSIVSVTGGTAHPSGAKGATETQMHAFLAAAQAQIDWLERGSLPEGETKSPILPLGSDTAPAFDLMAALRDKLDQYFAQCMAAELDPAIAQRIGPTPAELGETDFSAPASIEALMRSAPIARPSTNRSLAWDEPVNPVYAASLRELRSRVVQPLLGEQRDTFTETDWLQVKKAFAPYETWKNARPAGSITGIEIDTLRRYIQPDLAQATRELIAESSETALALDNVRLLEKLILYQANILLLVNNFTSFPYLYDAKCRAAFEMGTLIMDRRRFNLALKVDNRPQHAQLASSSIYTMYVEITPKRNAPKYEVAVPVTAGGKGNIAPGKRCIFHDTDGNECDAQVLQIIDNPVSLSEAIIAPFQRLAKVLTGRIEAITAEAERKLDTAGTSAVDTVRKAPEEQQVQPAVERTSKVQAAGLLLGGSVAIAAIGSSLAYITKTVAELPWYAIIIGLLAAVAAVAVPTAIIALIKLRRRDLSAILEGSGWAINERMRVTFSQSRFLTRRPPYPHGSTGLARYRALKIILVILALLVIGSLVWGLVSGWLGGSSEEQVQESPDETARCITSFDASFASISTNSSDRSP